MTRFDSTWPGVVPLIAGAQVEWQAFETAARAEMSGWDNANVELIYYCVDHTGPHSSRNLIASLSRSHEGVRQSERRPRIDALANTSWDCVDGKTSEAPASDRLACEPEYGSASLTPVFDCPPSGRA